MNTPTSNNNGSFNPNPNYRVIRDTRAGLSEGERWRQLNQEFLGSGGAAGASRVIETGHTHKR